MARIPQETIDRIRDSAEILDIVSDYVELRRRGRNFFGLCPFHPEKTPSFSVAPDKQIFHCFGCGTGGNVISFLMEYEKVSFVEALQKLAERYGIELDLKRDDGSQEFFSQLYDIHSAAVEFFRNNLSSGKVQPIRDYLNERGLSDETVDKFALGYADDGWDRLLRVAKSKKLTQEVIEKCGLFTKTDKGIFDRFRNRLMFPITNRGDRVVAFGGRDMSGESEAKYLNSPETPIYNKREILYGLSQTKDSVREQRSLVVVEGYMDFLQLYQHGVTNIAATSGTALTTGHVSQMRKFADTVHVAYDGDAAGKKAAIGAGYSLLKGGVTPKIVNVPAESDPDSWVRKAGVDRFREAVEQAEDVLSFQFGNTTHDLTNAAERSRFVDEIAAELAGIGDEIIRRDMVRQVAERMSVDEKAIVRMVSKRSRYLRRRGAPSSRRSERAPASPTEKAEREIIKLLAGSDKEVVHLLRENADLSAFSDPVMKTLADYLMKSSDQNGGANLSGALDIFEAKEERERVSRLLLESSSEEDARRIAVDCLITLQKMPLKKRIEQERIRLRDMERAGEDPSEAVTSVMNLRERMDELEAKRKSLLKSAL